MPIHSPFQAGISHIFVNLGSDHPSIIEAMVRGKHEKGESWPRIITCPNEMVALSMADGFARLTNKPQAVIVHVDVGTQGLAAAVHNASCGRCPVLIFAGLSPYTIEGEYRGSRTEYIHWIQDVPDQKQIVAQYCRYTGEIKRGRNVKQLVNRALQFATSDPQGPVYLYGAREAMEEDINPYYLDQSVWHAVAPPALPDSGVQMIANGLTSAKLPLMIQGYTGRNPICSTLAVELADLVPNLQVLDTGGCDMCFPADHPACLGFRYGSHEMIPKADFILVVDCDVPWIPTQCKPSESATIVHIDADPLKQQMPVFYIHAKERFKADSATAFTQLIAHLKSNPSTASDELRKAAHANRMAHVLELGTLPETSTNEITISHLGAAVRAAVPTETHFCIEAVTLGPLLADQLQLTRPKSWINCGGGGLGWSGGAALGIKLATDYLASHNLPLDGLTANSAAGKATLSPHPPAARPNAGSFLCHIVGDGTFLFSVPSSVYWISQRYQIPILTIVLNNGGWNAPRKSLLLVHPDGEGAHVDNKELNISFEPTPDFPGIAMAAMRGEGWAGVVQNTGELAGKLAEAVSAVKGGKTAVLEVRLGKAARTEKKERLPVREVRETGS